MSTVNRAWLKRQVELGKVYLVESYHFDDMLGESRFKGEIPVRMKTGGPEDWKEGFLNLTPWDFKAKSGHAYRNENGTIHLRIHSNCNYDLKIKA